MGNFYGYKSGAIRKIKKRNESVFELNKTINKFFTHLTTVLLLFLGLIVQMRPEKNGTETSFRLFLLLICLLVMCLFCCIAVLYSEIIVSRKIHQQNHRELELYIENDGEILSEINVVGRHKFFEWAEKLALLFLVFSLLTLILYVYSKK